MQNQKINLLEKFNAFSDHWHPRIIAELNGQQVKLARVKGDFIWHHHPNEDELFYVVEGTLWMDFRDRTEVLQAGEMILVPRGIEHRPRAEEETLIMLFEPASTLNTGNITSEQTKKHIEKL